MLSTVFFDLETTGLNSRNRHDGVEILSIGAVTSNGFGFKNYLKPTCDISLGAYRIHGLEYDDYYDDLYNTVTEEWMDADDMTDGLQDFMDYLDKVSCYGRNDIVLVAHNNFGFDSIVLENNLYDFGIDFPCNVYFADSITIMKHLNETIGYDFKNRYSLNNCLNILLDRDQAQPHDAYEDAIDCRDISLRAAAIMGHPNKINRFFRENGHLLRAY